MSSSRGPSPARVCAFTVIRRVFEQGAYADRALRSEAADLDPRERALATTLAYGTVQRRATLDHVITRLSARQVQQLDAPVLAALRLGLFQLLFLGGIAGHAAVNQSVELAKRSSPGGASLVNAVLRRATREGAEILAELDDRTALGAALRHSVPRWLAELWWRELGAEQARALLGRINEPAESAIRINSLVAGPDEMMAELPAGARPAPGLPEGRVLDGPFDAHGSRLFERGAIMPQSRASMLVSRVLEPTPGQRVLDLCAAPGAKTTHLAALMEDAGELIAVERHPGRARALERTCRRMAATCVDVRVADAAGWPPGTGCERVLVDPPCSGLGTLQSRPDLRWRVTETDIGELADQQGQILDAAGAATAPGGTIVYSVCTISRAESEAVVAAFLRTHPEFALDDLQSEYPHWGHPVAAACLQLLPHRDDTDGFFIARLRRSVRS